MAYSSLELTDHVLTSFLSQVIKFTAEDVATFIAVLGVLSVISQVIITECGNPEHYNRHHHRHHHRHQARMATCNIKHTSLLKYRYRTFSFVVGRSLFNTCTCNKLCDFT